MIMLRLVALPTAVVNLICMVLAAMTRDLTVFAIGWAGTVFALYGWLYYTEELRDMGQTPKGYRSLAIALRIELLQEGLQPGERLPSTKEYAQRYGTTRTTVARALKILADDKVVEILRGRGTYLLGPHGRPAARYDRPRDLIEAHLLAIINTNPVNTPLPDTRWVAENLDASEMTVRRVEASLLQRGLIRRTRSGRYVKA